MTEPTHTNRLLSRMTADDRNAVLAIATTQDFVLGDTICAPGEPLTHLHFVNSGIISVVTEMSDGRSVESFMIGLEGVAGSGASAVPADCHGRQLAQVAGSSMRVASDRFRNLAEDRPGVRSALARYVSELQAELEQSTGCNALHGSAQRLAKWLLRCHDRVEGDVIHLTQEYLATMLGAQRTTVNEAAQSLQTAGAIRYSRGKLTVLDRDRLERSACECYQVTKVGPN
jgi:CRP-like cAMP-binding protein